MSVHDNALGFVERHAQDDVRRLARHTGQFQKFLHRLRNLAAVFLDDHADRLPERFLPCFGRSPSNGPSFPVPGVFALAKSFAVLYRLKRAGVTVFTVLSVLCADRIVAISSCRGFAKSSAHFASGYAASRRVVDLLRANEFGLLTHRICPDALPGAFLGDSFEDSFGVVFAFWRRFLLLFGDSFGGLRLSAFPLAGVVGDIPSRFP